MQHDQSRGDRAQCREQFGWRDASTGKTARARLRSRSDPARIVGAFETTIGISGADDLEPPPGESRAPLGIGVVRRRRRRDDAVRFGLGSNAADEESMIRRRCRRSPRHDLREAFAAAERASGDAATMKTRITPRRHSRVVALPSWIVTRRERL